MKQIWITKTGGPEVLEVREAPRPEPGPGEVLIRVEAAGVNFADVMARRGLYPGAPKPPCVVGYEVAGTVEAAGPGAGAWEAGAPVLALTRFGGYASHVAVPARQVFARPEGMPAELGAALAVNYLTAFQALVVMGGIRHAQELGGLRLRVLVHGASGGVGTAAADVARIYSTELFGTASAHHLEYARERGYDHAIDYRGTDWVREVERLTEGRGVDLVLDPIGGSHWAESLRALAPTGRLVVYGISAALGRGKLGLAQEALRIPWRRFSPFSLMQANHGVLGLHLGTLWDRADEVAAWMRRLLAYYGQGKVRPHVDRTFAFEEAAEAHAYIEERRSVGKVVLVP